ncbi:efflux RND transporter periplasmic adaptor subunit [Allosphingosinicella deserti]|uniref:Efflux RND transporter periplasmic adaptor subunit n=1 Tax=Allosphingosinicella deserti TaxID=2116704 RepID=A0A2P7QKD5_9SPHN|nr:efflux RND transporter periplasmic adaptor subunit [Sphingomonas deserti]PSJ38426.1 efflux RND transporter periplasmic adaptor subunit [Sphingomonas deserti]
MRREILRATAIAICLALAACGSDDDAAPKAESTLRDVSVTRIELRPLLGGITASGVLVAREEAAVGAEVGGYRVTQVLAEEGDFVRAGQPLVRMDPTLLQAQIAELQANLAQQRAQAAQAGREAARVAGLDREGVVATEQIEQRRTAATTAAAQVRAAQAQIAELRTRLGRLTINAPVSGRILERTVRPGDIAAVGGTPMFRIARSGLVELQADVPETELGTIRVGQPAQVELPSGETVTGNVRTLSAEVNGQSRLGAVLIALPARPVLRVGGFGRANFNGAISQTPALPEDALRFDAEGVSVMVLRAGNRAHRMPVRTGRRAGGWVEIVSGPPVGTIVLLGGGAFVLEGEQVRPVRGTARASTGGASAPSAPARPANAQNAPAATRGGGSALTPPQAGASGQSGQTGGPVAGAAGATGAGGAGR